MAAPTYAQNLWQGDVSTDVTNPANWSAGISQYPFGDTTINAGSPNAAVWAVGGPFFPGSLWSSTTKWDLKALAIGSGAGQTGLLTVNAVSGFQNGSLFVDSGPVLAVGVAGGTGVATLNLGIAGQPGIRLDAGSSSGLGLAIGVDAGSNGTLNVLGSGKTTQSQAYGYATGGTLDMAYATHRVGAGGGTGVVNIQDGALALSNPGSPGPVPVLSVGLGGGSSGTINVLAGGKLTINPYTSQSSPVPQIGANGGVGAVNVQGSNAGGYASNAVFGSGLDVGIGAGSTGSLNLLAGGKALNYSIADLTDPGTGLPVAPPLVRLGVDGGQGNALVSGADAIWYVGAAVRPGFGPTDPITDGTQLGMLHVGVDGTGSLTIADGAVVTLGTAYIEARNNSSATWYELTAFEDGTGNLYLGETASGNGTLNIGAAAGSTPVAPGELRAAQILLGPGSATVSFNHTSSNYQFDTPLVGSGILVNLAGITYLVPATSPPAGAPTDNSAFAGVTQLRGGGLGLTYNAALGSSNVQVLGNGALIYGSGVSIGNAIAIDPAAVLEVQSAANATQAGAISGGGALSKTGAGTLALSAINPMTGEVRVNEGVLALAGAGALSDASRVVADATFDVSATAAPTSIRTLSGTGVVNLGSSGLTLSAAADTFAGVFTGSGMFAVAAGSEILTGASTGFIGSAAVQGGQLWVNGILGNDASTMQVSNGARLGGNGTLGGDVSIDAGGLLSPGAQAGTPGTLSVGGDLSLASGAILDYDFGEAGMVGGAFNDLLDVAGNLNLDGVINVTETPGGAFHAGLYRVINYAGTLNDQGLELGTVPVSGLVVETAIPGQVNLVLAPPTPAGFLEIWDGDAGPKNDGVINGGNGVWQSSAGNDNWTNVDGTVNAPFADGGFAIFAATPGQVQVDNSLGEVAVTGMQFAADGYRVSGGAITLQGPAAIVRVGDGTLDGEAYTATFDAELSGTAELVKADLGTLVLGGANSYSGGTRVFRGTLQVSSDANLGAAAGGIAFDAGILHTTASFTSARAVDVGLRGTIETDAGTTFNVDGAFSGAGELIKTGAGTLHMLQGGPLSGPTQVLQGSLMVDGNLGNSAVTVANAALLGGHGTVGATTLTPGSTVAPGNSIGTLSVNGAYVQQAGAVYALELDPASDQSDRIAVTGTGTLDSGAVLDITQLPTATPGWLAGRYGVRYTVLTTTGGLAGTYQLTGNRAVSAFASLVDVYDANNAYLQIMQTRGLTDVACSPNQHATAGGLQSAPDGNAARSAVLGLPDDAAACDAFGQLSGELYATARTVFLEDSRFLREAVGARLRADDGIGGSNVVESGQGLWGHAFGSWGNFRANRNVSELDRDIGGFFVGFDGSPGAQWRLGVLGGYSQSSFDVDALRSSGSSDDLHLGAYAGVEGERLRAQFGAAYTWHDVSTSRNVAFAGYSDRLEADFDASTFQLFGELGHRWQGGTLELEPFLGAAYVRVDVDGFSESGGAAALSAASDNMHVTYSTLGLRAATALRAGDDRWQWRMMAAWRHAFGTVEPTAWLQFDGGQPYSVVGVPIDRDVLALEFGLEGKLSGNADVGLLYSGQMGNDSEDHGAKAYVAWRF
ncbi:MAG TPA: autotransporter domain-containing protein [Stenotrophomonas sp.]|nr:autotransporter domain-containing protein [Stenotrophomonas sp.]